MAELEEIDTMELNEVTELFNELEAEHKKAVEVSRDISRVVMDFPMPGDRIMNFTIVSTENHTDLDGKNKELWVTITPSDNVGMFANTTMEAGELRDIIERRWKALDTLAESIKNEI